MASVCVGSPPRRQATALTLITYRLHDHEPASSQMSARLLATPANYPTKIPRHNGSEPGKGPIERMAPPGEWRRRSMDVEMPVSYASKARQLGPVPGLWISPARRRAKVPAVKLREHPMRRMYDPAGRAKNMPRVGDARVRTCTGVCLPALADWVERFVGATDCDQTMETSGSSCACNDLFPTSVQSIKPCVHVRRPD
ncbi:hypothetical protein J3F83DRAFT_104833 [Trichoderma novae-zelandiae]